MILTNKNDDNDMPGDSPDLIKKESSVKLLGIDN